MPGINTYTINTHSMNELQRSKIEIAKEILLVDYAEPVFRQWTAEEIKECGIPSGEMQEILRPSSKNIFSYEERYDSETRILSVWQTQTIDCGSFNYCIQITEDGELIE
jgi:hypothetical protein